MFFFFLSLALWIKGLRESRVSRVKSSSDYVVKTVEQTLGCGITRVLISRLTTIKKCRLSPNSFQRFSKQHDRCKFELWPDQSTLDVILVNIVHMRSRSPYATDCGPLWENRHFFYWSQSNVAVISFAKFIECTSDTEINMAGGKRGMRCNDGLPNVPK